MNADAQMVAVSTPVQILWVATCAVVEADTF